MVVRGAGYSLVPKGTPKVWPGPGQDLPKGAGGRGMRRGQSETEQKRGQNQMPKGGPLVTPGMRPPGIRVVGRKPSGFSATMAIA